MRKFLTTLFVSVSLLCGTVWSGEYNYAPKPLPSAEEVNRICQQFEKQIDLRGYQKAGPATVLLVDFYKSTVLDKHSLNLALCAIPLTDGKKFAYFVYLTKQPKLGPIRGVIE